jgi:uncharacterized peroxidase-related enzyme
MSRLAIPSRDEAPVASLPMLDAVFAQLGTVPNLFFLIGLSPSALEGFSAFSGALKKTLDVKTRERIALAVAQVNGCEYCLSAHSYFAANLAKLSPEEIVQNRNGRSEDRKAHAAVSFAAKVTHARGRVTDGDIAAVHAAGYDRAQVVEIFAIVAENCFTNFLNEVAKTDIDFPVVLASEVA